MTIHLGKIYEDQLLQLASSQGREVGALILEAVREYLEAASITDLGESDLRFPASG